MKYERKVTLNTCHDGARYRMQIEMRIELAQLQEHGRTIDLEPIPAGSHEMSMVVMVWRNGREDSAGQLGGDWVLEMLSEHPKIEAVRKLHAIAKRWHSSGTNAGTRAQRAALDGLPRSTDWYGDACKHLDSVGLREDRGYRFGHAWLYEPLPNDVIAEANALLDELAKD